MAVTNEAVDLNTDYYLYADDPRSVTISTESGSDDVEYAQVSAKKRSQATSLAGSSILGEEATWNIPVALLDVVGDIQPGDLIVEHATTDRTWIVNEATLAVFEQQWLCASVLPGFGAGTEEGAFGPGHKVDILTPSVRQGQSTGAAVETFVLDRRNVPCWVQPALPQLVNRFGAQEGSQVTSLVWFDSDPKVDTSNVFHFGERVLMVLGRASNVNGLSILWVVPCRENE